MDSTHWRYWLNIGGQRLRERHTSVEFYDHKLKIGDSLSDGSIVPAEVRYMMNYFSGNTAYLGSNSKLAGVVQMQKRDTGVISVIFNENGGYGRRMSTIVAGTKSVQKDVLAEAAYIHGLETIFAAHKIDPSNTQFADVFFKLKDVQKALYESNLGEAANINIVKAVNSLTSEIEGALVSAAKTVQTARGAAVQPEQNLSSYSNYSTLDVVPKSFFDDLDLADCTAGGTQNMAVTEVFSGTYKSHFTRRCDRKREDVIAKTGISRYTSAPVTTSAGTISVGASSASSATASPVEESDVKPNTYAVAIIDAGSFEDDAVKKISKLTFEMLFAEGAISDPNIAETEVGEEYARNLLDEIKPVGIKKIITGCSLEEADLLINRLEGSGVSVSVISEKDGTTVRQYKTKDPEPKMSNKPVYASEHKEYIHKKDRFYEALMSDEYKLDLDEFAPLIALCYQEAGENITDEQISEMLKNAKTHIPSAAILDSYVPIEDFQMMLLSMRNSLTDMLEVMKTSKAEGKSIPYAKLMKMGVKNWYLVGPPGSGKSISAQAVAAALGLPYYSISGSRNVEEDMFQGGLGIKNGKQDNISTPYVEGIHNIIPSIVSIEELNALAPGVALTLNAHCEVPHTINLYGQQMVRRNPGAFIVASGNRDLAGIQEQNIALMTRFLTLYVKGPSRQALFDIAKNLTPGGVSVEAVDYTTDCYLTIRQTIEQNNFDVDKEELLQCITFRGVKASQDLIYAGIDPREAVKKGLIGPVANLSLDARQLLSDVVDSKPTPKMPETER